MVKALLDTNILIDYLRGVGAARTELGRYQDKAISIITWMEVLVGAAPGVVAGGHARFPGRLRYCAT